MKTIVVLFAGLICAACLFHSTKAAPADAAADLQAVVVDGAQLPDVEAAAPAAEQLSRQKRATCDLLSGTGVNHSACAAHCLLRGNRGGYCNGRGVCVCRN